MEVKVLFSGKLNCISIHPSALHFYRIDFWKKLYQEEKQILLQQYKREMEVYKERKFNAYKELECVHYGLEDIARKQREESEQHYLEKVDSVKSKVCSNLYLLKAKLHLTECVVRARLENHNFLHKILAIGPCMLGQATNDALSKTAFVTFLTIAVHCIEHVKALLNGIDQEFFQFAIADVLRHDGQHAVLVREVFSVRL